MSLKRRRCFPLAALLSRLDPATGVAAAALLAATAYVVLGGADFGGGVWDLFATGPQAGRQRKAISQAIGPVWEANHVWLIFLAVLLFTGFPAAFAAISVAFFATMRFVLLGIVLRGAAFVFRNYGAGYLRTWRLWASLFGIASAITPLLLGITVGALSTGGIRVAEDGTVAVDAGLAFYGPVSLLTGLLTLALCAYLAAVYLTVELQGDLQRDFQRRALIAWGAAAILAGALLPMLAARAPWLWARLAGSLWLFLTGAVLAALSAWFLITGRYRAGRVTAVAQVVTLLWGWALAQWPYLVYPDVTFAAAAAPRGTLRFILTALVPGMAILLPSLWFLFKVFKGNRPLEAEPQR